MKISELAEQSGLSIDTIRFYEKKGLMDTQLIHRKTNNYRDYSQENLKRLRLIQQAKQLGFTLTEIRGWIQEFANDRLTRDEKKDILLQKIEQVDHQIEELGKMKIYLTEQLDCVCGSV